MYVHICYTNTSYCSACFCQLPVHQIAFSVAVEFPSSAHAPLEAHGLAGSPGDFPPDLRPRPPPTAPGDAACGKSCLWKWPCLAVLIGWCKNAFPRRGAVLCQVVLPAAKMGMGWGREGGGRGGTACQAAWATYKQTSGLFLQHIVVEGGGWALTVSGAPFVFCVNLGEHCF